MGESKHDRAARFFATHGMEEVGRMLGDEMSAEGKQRALKQAAESQRFVSATAGPALRKRSSPAEPHAAGSAGMRNLDADLAMEEDDKAYKSSWQAVEALQHRAPASVHCLCFSK